MSEKIIQDIESYIDIAALHPYTEMKMRGWINRFKNMQKEIESLKAELDVTKEKNFELENTICRLLVIKEEHQKEIESLKAELAKERSVVDKIEHCLDVFSISNLSRKNLLTIARQRQKERNER